MPYGSKFVKSADLKEQVTDVFESTSDSSLVDESVKVNDEFNVSKVVKENTVTPSK